MPITGWSGGLIPISGGGGGPTLILDQLSGTAVIALSSRKMRATYSGFAMNVTRSSDSTTQDIGFTGTDLNTTTLASFVGSNNGTIAKWYDQSGNTNDAVNVTPSLQPQVVLAGTNNIINGHVAPLWSNSATTQLVFPNALVISQPITIAACFQYTSANRIHLFDGTAGVDRILIGDSAGMYQMYAGNVVTSVTNTDTSLHTIIAIFNTTSSNLYLDGVQIVTNQNVGTQTWGDGTNPEQLGHPQGSPNAIDGYITEVIVMNNVMSAGDMSLIRSSWHSYWGAP